MLLRSGSNLANEFSPRSQSSRVGDPIQIWCNNNFVIQYAKDPKLHRKAKHIKRRYLFVRDAIKLNEVVVKFLIY